MQKLEIFQSLWAMDRRIPGQPEAPVAEHFQRIAAAGYHGVCIDPALAEIDEMRKLKPLFDWKLTKPVGKRGNRSNIPYDADSIKLTQELMKLSPGATVSAEGGIAGTLLTVQVLVKLDVGGQIKTVSISNIERVDSRK